MESSRSPDVDRRHDRKLASCADILAAQGIDASVVHFHTVEPFDEAAVLHCVADAQLVVTVEEGIGIGGFGSAVTDLLVEKSGHAIPPILRLALPDEFPHNYGIQNDLLEIYGLMPEQIAGRVALAAKKREKVA